MSENTSGDSYYSRLHQFTDGSSRTIYGIWEDGEAVGDSITPSTFVPEYRDHMSLKLSGVLRNREPLVSLGCGNAVVEGTLVADGHAVSGLDLEAEAVQLAAARGVDAWRSDFNDLEAGALTKFGVVYADGFFGHLCNENTGLQEPVGKLRALVATGAVVVIANDAPPCAGAGGDNARFAPHAKVPDFWYLSCEYLSTVLETSGFEVHERYYYPYRRPISGVRNRTIVVGKAI